MKKSKVLLIAGLIGLCLTACGKSGNRASNVAQTDQKASSQASSQAASQADSQVSSQVTSQTNSQAGSLSDSQASSQAGSQSDGQEEQQSAVSSEPVLVGGLTRAESPVVPSEVAHLFDGIKGGEPGYVYTPVAYLGSQVVAGTNHLLLCKVNESGSGSHIHYALVTVYEDLDGNAEITEVRNSSAEADYQEAEGGWIESETLEATREAKDALEKASNNITEADFTLIANLAEQVVAGTNYCLLCGDKSAAYSDWDRYKLVYVYEDLEGNAEITDIVGFAEQEW
jgi:hypothetical protein